VTLARNPEPPRLRKFRRELIKAIPRVPNTKQSLLHMQQKPLPELMIDYVSWRSRYVGSRPRTVKIEPSATYDTHSTSNRAGIELFLGKVRGGDDLTPHLSLEPHTRGYVAAARAPGASAQDRWSDKDFILNTSGYHHFHLGTTIETKGHAARTDDLIFARASRDEFTVIAIFDHNVFDFGTPERIRLLALHDAILTRGMAPGTVYTSNMITTSGHTVHSVRYAQHCMRVIADFEPRLDDLGFVKALYKHKEEAPTRPKPEWVFLHLDLAIFDRAKPGLLVVQKGWN
jgi:hypothetical protein